MATLRGFGFVVIGCWLSACGSETSTVTCEQYIGKLSQCEVGSALNVRVCAQRYGQKDSVCSKTFDAYVTCMHAQSCTTLADPNHGTPCQNEFVAVDIDCAGSPLRYSRIIGDAKYQ